jgi:uracil-DNA glycosylase
MARKPAKQNSTSMKALLRDIRACRLCAHEMPHEPRPVIQASSAARICIAGQAPGTRVHASGKPFTDPSGDRLRDWLGVTEEQFYDETLFSIAPMGFCFPGLDKKGGDLPPLKRCAETWRSDVFGSLPNLQLTLLIGQYAQKWHLGSARGRTLTDTVRAFEDYLPDYLPMPHPSWRNNSWVKKNPWFQSVLIPVLRSKVHEILDH